MRVFVTGASGNVGRTIIRAMKDYPEFELVGGWCRKSGIDLGLLAGIEAKGVLTAKSLSLGLAESLPDVVIDFSVTPILEQNMKEYLNFGLNAVIGTTGLTDDQFAPFIKGVEERGLRWAAIANYGLGISFVQDFIKLVREYYPYISIVDRHHENMANAPSGTAADLACAAEGESGQVASKESYPGVLAGKVHGVQVVSQRLPWPGPFSEHEVLLGRRDEIIKITVTDHTSDIYTDGVYLTAQTLPLLPPGSFVRSLSEIRNYPR